MVKLEGIPSNDFESTLGLHLDVKPPRIPGHEVSGENAKVRSEVTRFEAAERVVVEPII